MTTQYLWVYHVNIYRALGFLNDGYGRLIFEWTARIWHYWQHLGRDTRDSTEQSTQPPDVDAYMLTPAETRVLLGTMPNDDATCVLFVGFEGQDGEWIPSWALVVSDTPLEEEDVAEDA